MKRGTPAPPRRQAEDYWFPMSIGLLESIAWLSCSFAARAVYCAIAAEYKRINNGIIGMGQREIMERAGIGSARSVVDALRQLETTGLLIRTYMGHQGPKRWAYTREELAAEKGEKTGAKTANRTKPKGIVSMWQFTDCPTFDWAGENERPPTLDYRKWKPGQDMRLVGTMEIPRKKKVKPTTNPKITKPSPLAAKEQEKPEPPKFTVLDHGALTGVDLDMETDAEQLLKQLEITDEDVPF